MRVTDKRMLDAIKKNGGAVYLAARELGCAPNTIYNRMEKTPALKQAVEDARGEVVDYAEQKLRLAILNGEPWAIAMALKTIGKSRGYVERQEVTGAEGSHIVVRLVGDVRDKKGFYRNFPAHTIEAFQDAGMTLYNEAVLVTAVGSLPIRVSKQFGGYRKLGKTHQNVLVFYKGDVADIKTWGDVECGVPTASEHIEQL